MAIYQMPSRHQPPTGSGYSAPASVMDTARQQAVLERSAELEDRYRAQEGTELLGRLMTEFGAARVHRWLINIAALTGQAL